VLGNDQYKMARQQPAIREGQQPNRSEKYANVRFSRARKAAIA
jgi:hypothetical protein